MKTERREPASRALRQGEGRDRVMNAARALFAERGVAGLSIRAIAARAGMPAMTLYGYFSSKTAIIRGLWTEAFDPLLVEMSAAEASTSDAKCRLNAVAQAMVDYWLRHPDRYRMVYLVEDRREAETDKWFIEETPALAAYLRFQPLIAAANGDRPNDYAREGEALVCALTGIVHMLVTVSEYPWAHSSKYVEAVIRGFCRP